MRRKIFLVVALAVVLAVLVWVVRSVGGRSADGGASIVEVSPSAAKTVPQKAVKKKGKGIPAVKASAKHGGMTNPAKTGKTGVASKPEEESRTQEAEEPVAAFDALTDRWIAPRKDGVTMKDVDDFVAQFRKVPKPHRKGCLQRALNLVPDENVMLLAGILLDKSQDKELITTVYNDVLNRDESVKKPILQQIFKDKDHPCWADTAWILDVTGGLPAKK